LFGGQKTGMSQIVFYDGYLVNDYVKEMISSRPGIKMDLKRMTVEVSDDAKNPVRNLKGVFK